MFKNLFSFTGRIRRTEYGISFIIYIIIYFILTYVRLSEPEDKAVLSIILLCYVPLLWFLWSQGAKRCHDLNKSGWWQIIPFYFFVLIFQAGDLYPNQYGTNPKNPNQEPYDPTEFYVDPDPSELNNI